MSPDQALDALAAHFGILPEFVDLSGEKHPTSPETKRALLRACGLSLDTGKAILEALKDVEAKAREQSWPDEVILQTGKACSLDFGADAWTVLAEDGQTLLAEGGRADQIVLPPLPSGIHDLVPGQGGAHVRLLVAPKRLPSVGDITGQTRLWGLNAALYGLQSDRNAGLGDFADLAELSRIAASHGAAFLGVNPVHALGVAQHETISPYSPSHRGFLNTHHIALDRIEGLEGNPDALVLLADIAPQLTSLRVAPMVDHAQQRRVHGAALERLFTLFTDQAAPAAKARFNGYCETAGQGLEQFAGFEAESEVLGPDWRDWNSPLDQGLTRSGFHKWLQWVADTQLADAQTSAKAAGMPLGLYLDLAVGARRGGAESRIERDSIADGVSIGAPPDHLSPEGQNWDLAAFAPSKLKADNYGALRRVLRATMRHAGILRIDHVLGLSRSFWIPDDGSPGAYIRQPLDALMAVIRIEADRARTIVIGEDLGLVPDGFRETMRRNGFYGYSVLQYERTKTGRFRSPNTYKPRILTCFGTHDTPTLAGFAQGRDVHWWHKLGWIGDDAADTARANRRKDIKALSGLEPGADNLKTGVHNALATSPAALISVQLDDVEGTVEAQNLPGTTHEHPNWQRKHMPLENLRNDPELAKIGELMRESGRSLKEP